MDYALNMRMQKPLEEYLELIERLSRASLYLLEARLDPFCVMDEPVHRLRGKDMVLHLWERRLQIMPQDKGFVIDDFSWGRKPACAYAHFIYGGGAAEGVFEIGFNEDGGVIAHREFWAGDFPFLGRKYAKTLKLGE